MEHKLLNYSKLQIPILSGSHSYVIMPALLSQIDTLPILNTIDDITPIQQCKKTQKNSQSNSIFTSPSNTILTNQNSNSNFSIINVSSDTESNLNTDPVLADKELQEKFCINFDQFVESVSEENEIEIVNNQVQAQHNHHQEIIQLNSPTTNMINKFIFKETESLVNSTSIDNLCNTMINDKEPTIINVDDSNSFHNKKDLSQASSFVNCDLITIPQDKEQDVNSQQVNNLIELSQETQESSQLIMDSNIHHDNKTNDEPDTLVLKVHNDGNLNLNTMINCYVSLTKIDENKFNKNGIKFKCSVCNENFLRLNDLIEHKDNEVCKEFYDSLKSIDDVNQEEEEDCDDDSIDENDYDFDIDEPDVQEPIKEKPRRKYTKNKSKMNSNLICEHCNKMCRTKAELMVHLHKHTGNPPDCWQCGKKCASYSNLVSHVQLHTGEKPYTCQFCGKQFTQDAHLTRHLRLHTGERPFVCKICGKTYKDYSYYKTHERIHRGERLYKCKYCNKEYYDASYYKKHIRLHTGEKPYMCTVCGKQFHRSDYLKLHSFQHTDERPFYCHICGKGFKMNYNLKVHLKNHENEQLNLNEESSQHELSANELSSLIAAENQTFHDSQLTTPSTSASSFTFTLTRVENTSSINYS